MDHIILMLMLWIKACKGGMLWLRKRTLIL